MNKSKNYQCHICKKTYEQDWKRMECVKSHVRFIAEVTEYDDEMNHTHDVYIVLKNGQILKQKNMKDGDENDKY